MVCDGGKEDGCMNRELEIGDVILLDGGEHIVSSLKGGRATCLPMFEPRASQHGKVDRRDKPKEVGYNLEPRLFLRRTGAAGLAEFNETKHIKPHMLRLEPGDYLCYMGAMCTVISVTPQTAVIGHPDGREFVEDRIINKIMFINCTTDEFFRLDEQQRAAQLTNFLATRKLPVAGNQQTTSSEGNDMKQATKPRKAKAASADKPAATTANTAKKLAADTPVVEADAETKAKTSAKATEDKKATAKTKAAEPAKAKSFAGSSQYIRSLIEAGDKIDAVRVKVVEKYGMQERMINERFDAQAKLVARAACN